MCSLPFSGMFHFSLLVILALNTFISSCERQGLENVLELLPRPSQGQSEFALTIPVVRQPGYISGTVPYHPNLYRHLDKSPFLATGKHNDNSQDRKAAATTVSSPWSRQFSAVGVPTKIMTTVPTSDRLGHRSVDTKHNQQLYHHRLSKLSNNTNLSFSVNETNSNYSPHMHFNNAISLHSPNGVIKNSILRSETNQNRIVSVFNYINEGIFGTDSLWKTGRYRSIRIDERGHLNKPGVSKLQLAKQINNKDQIDVGSPNDQSNRSSGKVNLSCQVDHFSEPLTRELFINRRHHNRKSPKAVRAQTRVKRSVASGHLDVVGVNMSRMSPHPFSARTTVEVTHPWTRQRFPGVDPDFDFPGMTPSFGFVLLTDDALPKLGILSRKVWDFSPASRGSERHDPANRGSRVPGRNAVSRFLQRQGHKPSSRLPSMRNKPWLDQSQSELDVAVTDRQFWAATQDIRSPNRAHLDIKYHVPITKRHFDQIGNGVLSGMNQNHIGKQYFRISATGDSLRRSTKRTADKFRLATSSQTTSSIATSSVTTEYPRDNEFENVPSEFSLNSLQHDDSEYLYHKGPTDSAVAPYLDNLDQNPKLTQSHDSYNEGSLSTFNRHSTESEHVSSFIKTVTRGKRLRVPHKRLDTISNGALGGIRQNFLDKKYFEGSSKDWLPDNFRHFIPNKYSPASDSPKTRQHLHVAAKADFAPPRVRWRSNLNYGSAGQASRGYSNPIFQPKSNLSKKRNKDLIVPRFFGHTNANFLDQLDMMNKRAFDSISTSAMSGLGQNFIGKSHSNTKKVRSRMNDLYTKLLLKQQMFNANLLYDIFPNHNPLPSIGGIGLDPFRFVNKRQLDTGEDTESKLVDGEDDDNSNMFLDSIIPSGYFHSQRRSHVTHPVTKGRPFYSTFAQVKPEVELNSITAVPVNSLAQGKENKKEDVFHLGKNLLEKRSLDSVASFSSIFGLAENFIESTKANQVPSGILPWMGLPKRNLAAYPSAVTTEHDPDDETVYQSALVNKHAVDDDMLDGNLETGQPQSSVESEHLQSFLGRIPNTSDYHNHFYHVMDDDSETLQDLKQKLQQQDSTYRREFTELKHAIHLGMTSL